jgi:outer membrane protein assembly factor BamB
VPRTKPTPLIIGINGHVIALSQETGEEIWRTKIKSSSFLTLFQTGERIFAGASGELFCLHPKTGEILWHNKLKGLGHGLVAIGGTGAESSAMAAQQAAQAAQIAQTAAVAATIAATA